MAKTRGTTRPVLGDVPGSNSTRVERGVEAMQSAKGNGRVTKTAVRFILMLIRKVSNALG